MDGHFLPEMICAKQLRPIIVASHPRCGTHLLIDTLRLKFEECQSWKRWGERLDRLYLDLDDILRAELSFPMELAENILQRAPRPIIKTHAWPTFDRLLPESRIRPLDEGAANTLLQKCHVLYTYRDGRAAIRSLHLFMQHHEPAARVSFSQFIRQRVDGKSRPRIWADHVRSWNSRSDIFMLRMEDLIADPALHLDMLSQYLSLKASIEKSSLPTPARTVWKNRLARFFGRRPQSTAIPAQNSSKAPSWRQLMSREDCEFFQNEVDDLLITLGYEQSPAWVENFERSHALAPDRVN
jgi:hypothetical protein